MATRGRKPRTPAQPAGQDDIGPTAAAIEAQDLALQEAHRAQHEAEFNVRALARTFGYEGTLTVGALEDEIRFYQKQTVEALLETGKRLRLLRELTPHGEFESRVEMLGFSTRTAQRFMQAAEKTARSATLAQLGERVKNTKAFLELVTHDDDADLNRLAEMDRIECMSASQLRNELRQAKADHQHAAETMVRERERADAAERKALGRQPYVAPADERLKPLSIAAEERQRSIRHVLAEHHESIRALHQWRVEEIEASGKDAEETSRAIGLTARMIEMCYDEMERAIAAAREEMDRYFAGELEMHRRWTMELVEGARAIRSLGGQPAAA